MPGTKSVASTGDQDINGVLSGIAWSVNNLTYSFPTSASFYEYGQPWGNFATLNNTQKAAVNAILGAYSSFAALTFSQVTESATTHGDLRFAMSSDAAPTAFAYYPSSHPSGGDSWYDSDGTYSNPVKGNYAYMTFLHEIGHALGLKHGQETDTFGAMTFAHDSMEYSVMTYRSYPGAPLTGYTNETWGYAQTPMLYDIAALQHMYGANFSHNSGNTTYSWNPNTGEMSVDGVGQGGPGANRVFMTLWDGGGNDTYDFSSYTANLTIDLRPGAWTDTSSTQHANLGNGHIAEGNIANAFLVNGDTRSLIEGATGGSGNDWILGNQGNNLLIGNLGSDTLDGGLSTYSVSWGPHNFSKFNADARADIIQIGADGKAYVWTSSGSSFNPYTLWGSGFQQTAKIGDFNSDGRSDLIQFNGNGTGSVSLSNGTGFPTTGVWGSGFLPTDQLGDFNGDGRTDVVQLYASGSGFVWLSNGSGFGSYQYWGTGFLPNDKIGDFNGDGKDDIVQLYANGNGYVWLSNGTSFGTYGHWGTGFLPSDKIGDFNGDGKDDIVQLYANGNGYVWLSNGASFGAYGHWGTGFRPTDKIGDFNGDGKDDIIQLYENGTAYVWLSNGSGFNSYQPWSTGITAADEIADFNGDGRDDVIQLYSNGSAYVWLSNGTSFDSYAPWGTGVASGTSSGDDTLSGGPGADTFAFHGTFGNDTITDFTAGLGVLDVIELERATFADFNAVMANTTQSGLDSIIHFGDNTITVKNVLKTTFNSDDFVFV